MAIKKIAAAALLLVCAAAAFAHKTKFSNTFFSLLNTNKGSFNFSSFKLNYFLYYPNVKIDVNAGKTFFYSNIKNYPLLLNVNSVKINMEVQYKIAAGIQGGIYEVKVIFANFPFGNAIVKEKNIYPRFYTIKPFIKFQQIESEYSINIFYGNAHFSLNDFNYFIGKIDIPKINGILHTWNLKNIFYIDMGFIKTDMNIKNKNNGQFVFGISTLNFIKGSFYFLLPKNSAMYFFTSVSLASGKLKLRMTAKNQLYFLFPYQFYNKDFLLRATIFGTGFKYTYTGDVFTFNGAFFLYSVITGNGTVITHFKEKQNFIFNGKEKREEHTISDITGNHFLLIHLNAAYKMNTSTTISISKIIPVPILKIKYLQDSSKNTISDFDFILSGLSVMLTQTY